MNKRVLTYIAIAYLFSLLFRYFLFFLARSNPEFIYADHIISLWTADAGLYGHYAKELLAGKQIGFGNDAFLGHLIYWVVKYTGLHIDTVMFTIPAFLASLIVVPIILIGYELGILRVGFWSALATSIGMNYYFRTHMGYTDTDILNFTIFFSILYSYIALIRRKSLVFALIAALLNLFFIYWYHSAKPLAFGLWLFFVLYLLVLDRKNVAALLGAVVAFTAFLPVPVWMVMAVAVGLGAFFWLLLKRFAIDYRYILALFVIGAALGGWYGYKHKMFDRAIDYLAKKEAYVLQDKSKQKIELEATLKTVAEARGITIRQLVTYSSGGYLIFVLGTLGLLLLVWRRKEAALLLLPYIIGLVSLKAGVRFTTFAVPAISFGFVYLFYELYLFWRSKRFSSLFFYAPALFLVAYYLNVMNGYNKMLSPFFTRGELQPIDTKLNRKDKGYILTWWDYGWPLWYYTNKRTIIDNGKHHYDNYIVAKTLFAYDQNFVANFDRFFVENYDRIYPWAILPYIIKKIPLREILRRSYEGTLPLPPKKNEIYYYFDDKILTKLPVIESFSYLKGEKRRGFVWVTKLRVFSTSKALLQGDGVSIDLRNGQLVSKQGKDFIGTLYVHDGEKIVASNRYRRNNYAVIVYKNRYIIGAYRYINSFFFQAFFFDGLDRKLFKTLHYDKSAKIFQLTGR